MERAKKRGLGVRRMDIGWDSGVYRLGLKFVGHF